MPKQLRFGAIIRVSTEKQEKEGESLRTQEKQIEAAALQRNGIITNRYAGQEHATPDAERDLLETMLKDAQSEHPPFDAVMVADESRWSRDNEESKRCLRILRENNIRFFVLTEERDLFKATDRLLMGVTAEIGEFQASIQNEKSIINRIERARRLNAPTCGKAPFGRVWDTKAERWSVDENAKSMIADVARRYLAGEQLPRLAAEYGVNHSNLHKVLTRRSGTEWEQRFRCKSAGIDETVQTIVPRLLNDEIIKAILKKAQSNKTFERGKRVYSYLLGGLVFCQVCGYRMNGQTNHNGHRYYRHSNRDGARDCQLHPRPWVRAEELEETVFGRLFETFGNARAVERAIELAIPNQEKLKQLHDRSVRIQGELERIGASRMRVLRLAKQIDVTDDEIAEMMGELGQQEAALQLQVESIRKQLGNLPTADAIPIAAEEMAERFQGISYMRRRVLIRSEFTPDDARALARRVFAGQGPDGRPNGVYIERVEGQVNHRRKQWAFTLCGLTIGGTQGATKSAAHSPGTTPPALRSVSRPPPPRP